MNLSIFRRRAEPLDADAAEVVRLTACLREAHTMMDAKDAEIAALRRDLHNLTSGALAKAIEIQRRRTEGRDVQTGRFAR